MLAQAVGGFAEMLQTILSPTLSFDFNSLFLVDMSKRNCIGHKTKGWIQNKVFP